MLDVETPELVIRLHGFCPLCVPHLPKQDERYGKEAGS